MATNYDDLRLRFFAGWDGDEPRGEYALRFVRAELAKIVTTLDDAIELAEEGIGYTPAYFFERHGMQERLDEIKAKRDAARGDSR